jgi:hypothetical protein
MIRLGGKHFNNTLGVLAGGLNSRRQPGENGKTVR